MLTIDGEGLESKSLEITYDATETGLDNVRIEPLKAWRQNDLLHIIGLTPGKPWGVYNITGTLIYQSIADGNKADVNLTVRGVYIVRSGNETVKAMY